MSEKKKSTMQCMLKQKYRKDNIQQCTKTEATAKQLQTIHILHNSYLQLQLSKQN